MFSTSKTTKNNSTNDDKINFFPSKSWIFKTIIITLLIIFFRRWLEEVITNLIVSKILKYPEKGILNDIAVFSILIIVLKKYFDLYKRKFLVSFEFTYYIFVFVSFYSYYRWYESNVWEFTEFDIISPIKYFDSLLLLFTLQLFLLAKNFYQIKALKKEDKVLKNPRFILDEALKSEEQFILRKDLANVLAQRIINTDSNNSSKAFAITGEWGSGKTSFLEILKDNFKKTNSVIIDFNPWLNIEKESLITEFFKQLSNKLKYFGSGLKYEISVYSNLLIKPDGGLLNNFLGLINVDFLNNSIKSQKKTIENLITKVNKDIYVFIDDVDRLEHTEIESIIRLIRNLADFKHIKFIVAFEKGYVLEAIKKINPYNYDKYLEKIFLQTTELPVIHFTEIKNSLLKEFSISFPNNLKQINEYFEKNLNRNNKAIFNILKSHRDVKRFVNHFMVYYPLVEKDVFFDDFLRIELLRFKYPKVCGLLNSKGNDFLKVTRFENKFSYYGLTGKDVNNVVQFDLSIYLNKNFEAFNLQQIEIEPVFELIKEIFWFDHSKTQNPNNLSIIIVENFHKYFISGLLESDLSEEEFNDYYNKDIRELKTQITNWVAVGKKLHLLRKFESIDAFGCKNKNEFEKLIYAIVHLAYQENEKELKQYDLTDFLNKISDSKNKISNKFYGRQTKKYKEFLLNLLSNNENNSTYEIQIIKEICQKIEQFKFLKKEEMFEISLEIFKSKLHGDWNNFIWQIFHTIYEIEIITYPKKIIFSEQLNKILFNKDFEKHLDNFIFDIIDIDPLKFGLYKISSTSDRIFNSSTDFEEFFKSLESKNVSSKYLNELLLFLNQYLMFYGTNKYIEYDFETIPVQKKYELLKDFENFN